MHLNITKWIFLKQVLRSHEIEFSRNWMGFTDMSNKISINIRHRHVCMAEENIVYRMQLSQFMAGVLAMLLPCCSPLLRTSILLCFSPSSKFKRNLLYVKESQHMNIAMEKDRQTYIAVACYFSKQTQLIIRYKWCEQITRKKL